MKTDAEIRELLEGNRIDELIACLESADWDPNRPVRFSQRDTEYSYPLIFSGASSGNVKLVQTLIRLGVDVDARDDNSGPALMVAIAGGHEQVVELLLSAGASVDRKYNGETALMFAAQQDQENIVRMLLKAGALVSIKGSKGMTALSHALLTKRSHERMASLLLHAGSPVDGRDLHNPVGLRELTVVQQLLAKGCDVNVPFDWSTAGTDIEKGDTPLLVAVALNIAEGMGFEDKQEDRLAIIDLLLARGADVNVRRRSNGLTPLILAAILDDATVAERLIAAGADPKQEYECKLLKFPPAYPRTETKAVSAVSIAEMRQMNTKIRALLLR